MTTVTLVGWDHIRNYYLAKAQVEVLGVQVTDETNSSCPRDVVARLQFKPDGRMPSLVVERADLTGVPVVELGHHFGGKVIGTENLEAFLERARIATGAFKEGP